MFRFFLPQSSDPAERLRLLHDQFDAFTQSDALQELFSLLHTDADSFRADYNGRRSTGSVRETQVLTPAEHLEPLRYQLYPLLSELGFFHIDKPLQPDADHILILGGSLNACHLRANAGKRWITEKTRSVDGLACFRPIHPVEREKSAFASAADTEFGAMTDAFCRAYRLDPETARDTFTSDRNLNRISCIRTLSAARPDLPSVGTEVRSEKLDTRSSRPSGECAYRIFAAPSTQPDQRRADTGDTLLYYLQETSPASAASLLAVTHNRYCNRQFLQLAWYLLKYQQEYRDVSASPEHLDMPVSLDIIGLYTGGDIPAADQYDPYQLLQDLIGILDWIDRFRGDADFFA